MPIAIRCPKCGKKYSVKDELGGKVVGCTCGAKLKIPQPKITVAGEPKVAVVPPPAPLPVTGGAAPARPSASSSSLELPLRPCPRCRRPLPHDPSIRVCSACGMNIDDPSASSSHSGLHSVTSSKKSGGVLEYIRERSLVVWILVNLIAAGVLLALAAQGVLPKPGYYATTGMTFSVYMTPFSILSYWLIRRL